MRPRLSIVVPFFRVQDYIGDCLRSLSAQTFEDFEVVLVDDGSPDGSAAIADDFTARDPRFRLLTQENQGLGPARNAGAKHSVGEFITFVDSDDLVAPRAYESMIRTLDATGSSFAGGDVRRFNSSGVRESRVHGAPFAHDRRATHVLEFPELALDRMVWNKVYRRRFWDEFGYEFPAMRYEDYPVTLRAHLDAVTVDCLSEPVYYWRERESGESITDQSNEYSNLVDRVVGAEMVIDLVSRRAPELAPRVHRHLVRVDLLTLLQAFRSVPEDEAESYVRLGQRLVERLDEAALEPARRFDRLQIHALQTGDVTYLQELARFRHDHGLGAARVRRRPLMPWQYKSEYPGRTDEARRAPKYTYRVPNDKLTLHTTVTDVRWLEDTVAIRGTAEIRHLRTDRRSRLRVTLTGDAVEFPCAVSRFTARDSHGDDGYVGFELRIDGSAFASLPGTSNVVRVSVEMVNGRFRRRGLLGGLLPGSPVFSEGRWMRGRRWVQPFQGAGGRIAFKVLDDPARLDSVRLGDGVLDLCGTLPDEIPGAHLVLTGVSGGERLSFDLTLLEQSSTVRFVSCIPLAELVDASVPDDPVTQRTTWVVRLAGPDGDHVLVPAGRGRLPIDSRCGGAAVTITAETGLLRVVVR